MTRRKKMRVCILALALMGVVGCLNVVSANPYSPTWFVPNSPKTDKPNILETTGLLAFPPLDNQ